MNYDVAYIIANAIHGLTIAVSVLAVVVAVTGLGVALTRRP